MSELKEIKKKIENHEIRLCKLEKIILKGKGVPKIKETYKGLSGGIRLLIKNGFLDSPKSKGEIFDELKREGYYYSRQSVDKILRVDFLNRKKVLTRIKENKVWKYVLRK